MGLKPLGLKAVQFLSVIFTALALVPAGAHFFEMPAKLSLAQDNICWSSSSIAAGPISAHSCCWP